jgi:signal transduction histidine kinase/ActR/RegA family two-component response regulator
MTTILVVEDGSVVARDLLESLARLDSPVLAVATSGRDAIDKARTLAPDLLIVNAAVADELAREPDLPVVFVTAYAEREKQWFSVALDLVSDGVVTTNPDGGIIFANSTAKALFDKAQLEEIQIMLASAPISGPRGQLTGLVFVIRDLSEKNRLHDQLALADRMTSLGKMAAGIAHEINNPLAYIITNIELTDNGLRALSEELEPLLAKLVAAGGARPQRDLLGAIAGLNEAMADAREGTERVRRLVDDLRSFSHPDVRPQVIDPRRAIELAVRICAIKAKGRTALRTVFEPTPSLDANEGRLAQILINLIANAIEAIPEGQPDPNQVTISTRLAEDGRVEISVRDTGQGMDEQTRAQIFQPFFTTKPVGSGTGLGLSIVRRLVAEIGGEIQVLSEVGKGSTFKLFFPPSKTGGEKGSSLRPVQPRRARILVVDDEKLMLMAIRRQLGSRHEVVAMQRPKEALEQIKQGARFDVILCDLIMPELPGWDLFDELARIAPDQAEACVFVTGAAMDTEARAFLERVENRYVEKPFESDTLERALREVLEERRRRSLPQQDPTH